MNKAKIFAELDDMVVTRLFGLQPWLTDRETCSACLRKFIQMGLKEVVSTEPLTWRCTPLGKELDVDLFEVFMGLFERWDVITILSQHGLIDKSEVDAYEYASDANAESVLSGYVKRAYSEYRKSTKFLRLSRRAKPARVRRFEPADCVVVEAFSDLHRARHLKSNQFAGTSPAAVQRFERKAWDRLIDHLIKLPPPSDD